MILLEGVDRTGKTTVAEHLMRLLPGWSFVHQTKPDCHPFKYGMQRVANSHPRVVMDRLHWSNYAYGRVYDGSQEILTPHQWRITELALASRAATVVYMHDTVENILGRWGDGEMYPPTEIPQLLNHYHALATRTSDPMSLLDVRSYTLPDLVQDGCPTVALMQLAAECEYLAAKAATLPPASQGIGTIEPGFIVMCDPPEDRCEPCGDVPRFPTDVNPALWDILDQLECRWWEGYYTYTNTFRDPGHFAAIANRLGLRKVLAIGAGAFGLVREAKAVGIAQAIQCFGVNTLTKKAASQALDTYCGVLICD